MVDKGISKENKNDRCKETDLHRKKANREEIYTDRKKQRCQFRKKVKKERDHKIQKKKIKKDRNGDTKRNRLDSNTNSIQFK